MKRLKLAVESAPTTPVGHVIAAAGGNAASDNKE